MLKQIKLSTKTSGIAALVPAVGTSVASCSSCGLICIPSLLSALGISSGSFAVMIWLGAARPYLAALSLLFVGRAVYLVSKNQGPSKRDRVFVWSTVTLALAFLVVPSIISIFRR